MTGVQHHQRSLQAPGNCMSWRKTSFYGSWQDRFRLLFVPEATIANECYMKIIKNNYLISIIYNIYYIIIYYELSWKMIDSWPFMTTSRAAILEASQRQKCLTTSPGSTWGTLAVPQVNVARFGTGQAGSLRSWNPSVSWREIFRSCFF